jgi:hypothetical protein
MSICEEEVRVDARRLVVEALADTAAEVRVDLVVDVLAGILGVVLKPGNCLCG